MMETIADMNMYPVPGTSNLRDTLPELNLMVTDDAAILSYKKQYLIKFSARIRIAPEELVDYVNRGILQHMTEVDRISETTGLKITSRFEDHLNPHPFHTTPEPLPRLLLQQKWYIMYFMSEEYPYTNVSSGDPATHAAILEQLSDVLSPGKALVDLEHYRIYLRSLDKTA